DASTAHPSLSAKPLVGFPHHNGTCAVSIASLNARFSLSPSPWKKKTNASTAISPTDFAKTIPGVRPTNPRVITALGKLIGGSEVMPGPKDPGTNAGSSRILFLKIRVWSVHELIRRVTIRPTVAGEIACFRRGRYSLPDPWNWGQHRRLHHARSRPAARASRAESGRTGAA